MALQVLPEWGQVTLQPRGAATFRSIFQPVQREKIQRAARPAQDRQQTVAAENDIIPIVYGRDRVGAKVANLLAHNGNWVVQAIWCIGPIDAVESWQIADKAAPAGVSVTHYLGTAGQPVDPWLSAAFAAQGITYADTLDGVAYSVFRIPASNKDGLSLNAIIRGLKIYDPRSGLTAYSDNPALCLANLLSSTTHGAGRSVDWSSVAVVADACDALIVGEKSRTVGVTLDTARDIYDWADVLRTYAGCWIVQRDTGLTLIADAPATPAKAYRHTDGNIIGISPVRRAASSDSPTVMIVRWTNTTALPWRDDYVIVSAPGVDAGTVPRRESEIHLPGIQSASQARREAVRRLNGLTLADLSFSLDVFDDGVAVDPGAVVTVSHPVGLADKPMRVVGAHSGEPGIYTLDLVEYDPAAYSTDVVTDPTYPDTSLPQPGEPPAPDSLVLTEEVFQQQDGTFSSRLRATWVAPAFPFISTYRVTVSTGGVEVFTGTAGARATTWASPAIAEGATYQVDVSTISLTGATSDPASGVVVALGKQLAPGNVPSLDGFEVGGEVRLRWPPAVDIDIWRYEVRYVAVGGVWSAGTLIDRVDALTLVTNVVPVGDWDLMVKAVDSVGNLSPTEARRTITVTLDNNAYLADTYDYDTPALTNMTEFRLGRLDTVRRFVTTSAASWNSTFSSAMSGYTSPILGYFSAASTFATEAHDHGLLLAGNWQGELSVTDLSGSHDDQLELSEDGTTWDDYPDMVAKTAGRFSRLRATTSGVMLVTLPTARTRIDAIPRAESGSGMSAASGPTTVTLNNDYAAAKSIVITPLGTAARVGVVDNVQVGSPTTFDVYVFDTSGNQIAAGFMWSFEGV